MTVHERLKKLHACLHARVWASQYTTAQEVWDNCNKADWLFWWADREGQIKGIVNAAKEIADSVSHLTFISNVSNAADAYSVVYSAANAAANTATDADYAYKQQMLINMQIIRKHLHCPDESTW